MRSIFIITAAENRENVRSFLDEHCDEKHAGEDGVQWNLLKNGDGVLYISETPAGELFQEMEETEQKTYFEKLDREHTQYCCWLINISGRHDGTAEITGLLRGLHAETSFLASDGYTNYFWTFPEIESGVRIEGHRFFDFDGWYHSRR